MKSQPPKKAQKDKNRSKKASGKPTLSKWNEMNRKQRREMMRKMSGANMLVPSNSAFVYPPQRKSHEAIAASPRRALGNPDPGPRHHSPPPNCAVLSHLRAQFS